MTPAEARDMAERHYQAKLRAKLAELEQRFEKLTNPRYSFEWKKRLFLTKQIERVRDQLIKPVFVEVRPL